MHEKFSGIDGMTANSEKTPSRIAEGQPRAKQALTALGVCNEQVLSSKEKVCSELHGNM
jgi:hypothetical protein